MVENNISEKVLEKIKSDHLKPKPWAIFLAKRSVFFVITVIVVLLGSLSVAIMIDNFRYNDFLSHELIGQTFGGLLVASLPYFWIISFFIFLIAVYYNLKQTRHGYRYALGIVIGAYFLITIFAGSVLAFTGFSRGAEKMVSERIPAYAQMMCGQGKKWLKPESGVIAGMVVEQDGDFLILRDWEGKLWQVDCRQIGIPNCLKFAGKERVKIFGNLIDKDIFLAEEVKMMPIGCDCGCGMGNGSGFCHGE